MQVKMAKVQMLTGMIQSLTKQWDLTRDEFGRGFIDAFKSQMKRGLDHQQPTSLAMIKAFIPQAEHFKPGQYVSLDLSGTHFRIIELEINADEKIANPPKIHVFKIPEDLKKGPKATSAHLFNFIAQKIKSVVGYSSQKQHLGFTFAFPIHMESASTGKLIKWTKGWDIADMVGRDPVDELRQALQRCHMTHLEPNVLLNDTVGTLVVGTFENRATLTGSILGTGTNTAAWLKGEAFNFECGNFDLGPIRDAISSAADKALDQESQNPNHQLFEKMVSGRYLGDLMRRILLETNPELQYKSVITSADLSEMMVDDRCEADTRLLATIIMRRSAQLSALALIAVLE
jgi:hexokinase